MIFRPFKFVGRISTILAQRGSVSGMSDMGRHHTSWCTAGHRVFGRLDDEVGRPEAVPHTFPLVVGDEWLGRWHVLQIALQRPAVDPGDDRIPPAGR